MGSLREKVLSTQPRTVEVETEAYGTVRLRELTLAERMTLHVGLPSEPVEATRILHGRLLRLSIVDADGNPEFTQADELTLADRLNGSDGWKIFSAADRLNGGGARDEKKDSSGETVPGASS